ncbi:MAG TPA: hypothetical protein VGA78_17235 [Gemmatimonadales bacterium]
MPQSRAGLSAVMLSLAIAACHDGTIPTSPDQTPRPRVESVEPAALVSSVPGFGGFFLENGRPTIYLTDAGEAAHATGVLEGFLQASGIGQGELQVRRAEFEWAELERWFADAIPAAFQVDGTVLVDLDEAQNRIRIAVDRPGAIGLVRAALVRAGIPERALVIDQTEPLLRMATLRDRVRPIVGGLQINFPGFLCTLGFNATSGTQASFITASHCTDTQGGNDATPYWQPLQTVDPVQIGTEVADPAYQRNIAGCPRGRRCRRSDAARVAYAGGIQFTRGQIATTSGPNNGSLTITGNRTISGEDLRTNFTVGETLNKTGRTTGWTAGEVTTTCATIGVSGTNIVQICQTVVTRSGAVLVQGGDSGSPVFRVTGGNSFLAGILWGGNGSGSQFVFSPLANVEAELGGLTTTP